MALIVSSVPLLVRLLSSEYKLATEGSNIERRSKTNLRRSRRTQSQKRKLITWYLWWCVWALGSKKKRASERKHYNSSIIRGHYYLRMKSYIVKFFLSFFSSIYRSPTAPLVVCIFNGEGLTFDIPPRQGLWNRWHIFISSTLHQTARIQTQYLI